MREVICMPTGLNFQNLRKVALNIYISPHPHPALPSASSCTVDLLCVLLELQCKMLQLFWGCGCGGGMFEGTQYGDPSYIDRQPCCSKINDGQENWPDFQQNLKQRWSGTTLSKVTGHNVNIVFSTGALDCSSERAGGVIQPSTIQSVDEIQSSGQSI